MRVSLTTSWPHQGEGGGGKGGGGKGGGGESGGGEGGSGEKGGEDSTSGALGGGGECVEVVRASVTVRATASLGSAAAPARRPYGRRRWGRDVSEGGRTG